VFALSLAPAARAQLAGSVALTSDYRYRGLSLSDERPALSASVTYDHPSGLYGELTGVAAASHDDSLGYQVYAGYARRLASGASWDVGVTHTDVGGYGVAKYRVRYTEGYAGLSFRNWSARLYYSPDYLGEGVRTLYANVDASMSPRPNLRLFAHAGLLAPLDADRYAEIRRNQYDAAVGAAVQVKAVELKLTLSGFGPSSDYLASRRQAREAAVVSASYAF
jgi:uncharacterized protein (TIGR02001 family)